LGSLIASNRRPTLPASPSGLPAAPPPSASDSPSSNQRAGGSPSPRGQRPELVHARVLDPALAEVGHVGARDDAPRGPLELDATPSAAVPATVGFQETFELRGDVGQVPSSHFLYARMINDTTMRRPSTRCRRSADGRVLGGCLLAELRRSPILGSSRAKARAFIRAPCIMDDPCLCVKSYQPSAFTHQARRALSA
jgi:hypothetical protein